MSRDKNQISLLHFYILKKNQTPRVPKFLNNLWKMWIINNICHYNCFIHAYFASDLSCFSVNQILFRSCSWLWVRSLVIWLLWEGEIFRRIKYILLDATGNKGRKNHLSSHNVLFVNFWEESTLSAAVSLSPFKKWLPMHLCSIDLLISGSKYTRLFISYSQSPNVRLLTVRLQLYSYIWSNTRMRIRIRLICEDVCNSLINCLNVRHVFFLRSVYVDASPDQRVSTRHR